MSIFFKKRRFWVATGALLFFGLMSLWSHFHYRDYTLRPVPPEFVKQKFDTSALRADLNFMLKTFEEMHPDLYAYTSRDDILALKNQQLSSLNRELTRKEFYPIVARMAAAFGDGHTGVGMLKEEIRLFNREGGKWFPFTVFTIDHQGVQVKTSLREACPVGTGDWILSINGHPVDSLRALFAQQVSAETAHLRAFRIRSAFRYHLWINGIEAPYRLQWRRADSNEVRTTTVEGITEEEIRQFYRQKNTASTDSDYSFRWLEGNVGYLDFRRMRRPGAFEPFLQETFTDIQQNSANGLIIDLRNNGGGSTSLGVMLLSYITDKPYRMTARGEWKVTRHIKNYMKARYLPLWLCWVPIQYLFADGRRIWGTPDGEILAEESSLIQPSENPLRYSGPVCVLIGPRTFSSAQKLTNAIKDYQLATLIGEETGGVPNAFGEIYQFSLPNTRLHAFVSTKRFVRANGDTTWTRGILPDIEVKQNLEDVKKGVDTVLEFARRWCVEQGRTPLEHSTEK